MAACLRDTPVEHTDALEPADVQLQIAATAGNITDLGTLGGNYATATDINAGGLIVGYSEISTAGAIHAFYWQNGKMADIGTLGGEQSLAQGVGDGGAIVGSSVQPNPCYHGEPNSGSSAFLWETGAMSSLPRLPGGCGAQAQAINASGQIVGFSWWDRTGDGSTLQRPVMWDNGVLEDLAYPVSSDQGNGVANDINDNGQVVGYFGDNAFLWQNGVMEDLGTLGGVFSEADAINSSGQIVGNAHTAAERPHAFLWRNGTMKDLGTLGGSSSYAHDINDKGQVVGHSSIATGEHHAFVWQDGVMTDLGTMGGDEDYAYAYAINQTGQIVGVSSAPDGNHAVRWAIPTADFWSSRRDLPWSREAHAVASAGGRLYSMGGLASREQPSRTVQSFDPGSNIWHGKAPLPAARHSGNGAATISGRIYLAGGRNAAGALTRTLYVYEASTDVWSTKAQMPLVSGCGGSAAIGGKLYVFTGCTRLSTGSEVPANLLHRYDPLTDSWTPLRPGPVVHTQPAVAALAGKLYVAGGGNSSGVAFRRLDVYDPGTNTWTTRAPLPTVRLAAAGAAIAGKLLIVGGRNGTTYLNTVEAYDPVTNSWSSKATMPAARAGLGVGVIDNLLYGVGGRYRSRYRNILLKVNERYTP
jgi:probable HAF family extracellular repeat protein